MVSRKDLGISYEMDRIAEKVRQNKQYTKGEAAYDLNIGRTKVDFLFRSIAQKFKDISIDRETLFLVEAVS